MTPTAAVLSLLQASPHTLDELRRAYDPVELTCGNCGRVFSKPRARSSHERGHLPWVPDEATAAARTKARRSRWWASKPGYSAAKMRERRARDPEHYREQDRRYKERHRDELNAKSREYKRRNPEKVRAGIAAWRAANKVHMAAYSLRKRLADPAYRAALRKRKDSPAFREQKRAYERMDADTGRKPARQAVHRAITAGKLERQPCAVCGNPRVEAHHHAGYDRSNWLTVTWLCRLHHEAVHHPIVAALRGSA